MGGACASVSAVLPAHIVIFTGLYGMLLDERTHSWAAAEEALELVRRRRVALVFCTSKTRAEVETLRRKLGLAHPFITENGGGIFIPHGYFSHRIESSTASTRHEHCIALGRAYADITEALEESSQKAGVEIVNFRRMSVREIAENTGLAPREAELAKQRDFDEPFFLAGETSARIKKLMAAAKEHGLQISRGGQFWHAHGGSDIGRAVRELVKHYRKGRHSRMRSVALGSSANDLAMLAAVDTAILLPRGAGTYDAEVLAKLPQVRQAKAAGPAGWNVEVLKIAAPQADSRGA